MQNKLKKYFEDSFYKDFKAGLITAIVALPLALAFALASGVPAVMGLYTAIIAGFLGSLIGGSKFSITGPTGAMAVIILSTVNKYGLEALLLAGFLAGIFQIIFGLLKLGKVVKFIPLPVISGFTAGIGVLIFFGQISNFLGIKINFQEHIWDTFIQIFLNLSQFNIYAIIISLTTIFLMILIPKIFGKNKYLKNIPASILILIGTMFFIYYSGISMPVVGTIPNTLPQFNFINIDYEMFKAVLPAALTIALLGVIEALLCAVVADASTGTRHKSNKELIGQGITNTVLPFFGAMASTAAIARTMVNIKEGAKTKFAGVYHAIFLLFALLFLGDLGNYIPLAFLAGVLMVISIKMINIKEFITIIRISKSDTAVLLITFTLTILTDLVFAVQMGMVLAIFLLFLKLVALVDVKSMEHFGKSGKYNRLLEEDPILNGAVSIYTINGPFFFGAMSLFDQKISEHMNLKNSIIILRMQYVPFIDSTGIERLRMFISERKKKSYEVILSKLEKNVEKTLNSDIEFKHLLKTIHIVESTHDAIELSRKILLEKENLKNNLE